jgi:hypothetical protein
MSFSLKNDMSKQALLRFRMFKRKVKGRIVFYCEDTKDGKQESLKTKDKTEAKRLLAIKNEAHENRAGQLQSVNSKIARLYMLASDPRYSERTWRYVLDTIIRQKQGETANRWERVKADKALSHIWSKPIITTSSDDLLAAMNQGKVSTNVFLRRLHNYALDMGWLPEPIIVKRNWPKVRFKEKRSITVDEHKKIIDREKNPERRAFYELCWLIGASQGDVAQLDATAIDWNTHILTYYRQKTKNRPNPIPAKLKIGESTAAVLKALPTSGPLFPNLRMVRASDRATEFKQRCEGLSIKGITLNTLSTCESSMDDDKRVTRGGPIATR